jgi:hypothetical protein
MIAFLFLLTVKPGVCYEGSRTLEEVTRKIDEINKRNEENHFRWRAGITSLSFLTDEELKKLGNYVTRDT